MNVSRDERRATCLICGEPLSRWPGSCGNCGERFPPVRCIRRGWLRRTLEVGLPEGVFEVDYNGHGIGYESVTVTPGEVVRKSGAWFADSFDFQVAGLAAHLSIQISILLTIRRIELQIDGQTVYSE